MLHMAIEKPSVLQTGLADGEVLRAAGCRPYGQI
jgi:hypothetical protein